MNLPNAFLNNLQNYTQSSTGFTGSLSYQLHHSFKRIGITYSFDRSSIVAVSDASKILFTDLAFRGISGPNSLEGIITSKVLPSFSFSTIDSPISPKQRDQRISWRRNCRAGRDGAVGAPDCSVQALQAGAEGPQYDRIQRAGFFPGRAMAAWWRRRSSASISAAKMTYAVLIFAPSPRSRSFRTRAASSCAIRTAPWSPRTRPIRLRGATRFQFRSSRSCFLAATPAWSPTWNTGSPLPARWRLAPFVDVGMNPIIRGSQLRINRRATCRHQRHGVWLSRAGYCAELHRWAPTESPVFPESADRSSTNWVPRMSTGLEVQVFLPIINAPFRVYWAYNPLRLDNITRGPVPITRDMFPPGAAGDFTFEQAARSLAPEFHYANRARRFASAWRRRSSAVVSRQSSVVS